MRYKQIEAALVGMFGIADDKLGAFRARLKHLRALGIPAIPTPGSGERVDYTRDHLLHLAIAVQLELAGVPPARSAIYSTQILTDTIPHLPSLPQGFFNKDWFIGIDREGWIHGGSSPEGLKLERLPSLLSARPYLAVLNIATLVRWVDEFIKGQEQGGE